MQCESSPKFAHYIRALKTPKFLHKPSSILTKIAFSTNRPSMAPTWRRSSTTDDSARDVARQAAIRRRDIYMAIRCKTHQLYSRPVCTRAHLPCLTCSTSGYALPNVSESGRAFTTVSWCRRPILLCRTRTLRKFAVVAALIRFESSH